MRGIKCPLCGSRNVERIEKVKNGPGFVCRDCRKKFGETPLYRTVDIYRDIREHVKEISFTAGGYLTGTTTVEIKRTGDGAAVEVSSLVMDGPFGDFTITEGSWKRLVCKLYDHMFLNDWKHNYRPEGFLIMDGDFWSLDIVLDDGRKRRYHGSNAYPAYWSSLTYTMNKLIENKVI